MFGLSHVALHVALCKTAASLPAKAPLSMRLLLTYSRGRDPAINRVFALHRDSDGTALVEFDAQQGVYRLTATLQSPRCAAVQYVAVLPEHDRDVTIALKEGPALLPPISPAIVAGDSPAYEQPTVVLFSRPLKCDEAVGHFASDPIVLETSAQGYYASIFSLAGIMDRKSRMAALRLTDSSGGYHYIRLPLFFPTSNQGFAGFERFNVNDDDLQFAAGKPEDTLLCPRLTSTSAG